MFFNESSDITAIPQLISGGVMLSYHCSNSCAHCLYRCSPKRPNDWMSLEMAERVFTALSQERGLGPIHLAGGEATLRFELLVDIVKLAIDMNIPLTYLETNASWCGDRAETERKLEKLRDAGLPAVLVSASMFHNEFIPFFKTSNCVEVSQKVFGPENVIVWLPHLYQILSQIPDDHKTHSLEEFCRFAGLEEWSPQLPGLYHVIPGGRVPEALRKCYSPQLAKAYRGVKCRPDLSSTKHFHIDVYGNLFTGLCAGIAPGNIDDLHPKITQEDFPIFYTLCNRGPFGLMELAIADFGFEPNKEYISKCDLCYSVRKHLNKNGDFKELQPSDYYEV